MNILESLVQPNIDVWGNLHANPSSTDNQWSMPPPPPPVHIFIASVSFPLLPVQPTLPVHIVSSHESPTPCPPPPKDHRTTPHCSQIEKGKKLVTSTNMVKSSSSSHSKIKSTNNAKKSLHEVHPKIAQPEEKKSQYEVFIK
jgi:hypothetical protein